MVLIKKNYKWISLGILNLCSSFFLVSLAILSKFILDAAQQENTDRVFLFSGILLGSILLAVAFKWIENSLYARFTIAREMELKHLLLERRIYLEFDHNSFHSAVLMQHYTADIDHILAGEMDVLPTIFYQAGRFVCALILVAILDWKILLILLGVALVGLFLARIYSHKMKSLHKAVLDKDGAMNSFFQEAIENVTLVQAYHAQEAFLNAYDEKSSSATIARKKKYHLQLSVANLMILVSNALYGACICYGGYAIAVGLITYGSLLALTQLIQHLQTPILSISGLMNRYSLAKTSYERFNKSLIGECIEEKEYHAFTTINVSHISFSYQDKQVITDLSFQIQTGSIVHIAGESGIGKTTLCLLLMGIMKPQEGFISASLDGKELTGSIRSLFSYVPQDNILFSSTVRKNFELLAPVSEEKMKEALKFACLDEEITSLDTPLNERGRGLSLGQIQRLAIAIAYAKDRPIFLLDEFSSALDEANALKIVKHLKESQKTIIYISHKEENLLADQVIHMSK